MAAGRGRRPDAGAVAPPLGYETLAVPAPGAATELADDRPRVLVADDNADMRRYLVRLLAEHYRVKAVADGEAALASVRQALDLVLTDVMMPKLDGFGLLRELRADPGTRELPVILLSARAGEESRVEGLHAGADDYLIKPFSARGAAGARPVESHPRACGATPSACCGSRVQFKTLLDQAPIGVYVVDADFRIREINPVALPVFGTIPGGVVPRLRGDRPHSVGEGLRRRDGADLPAHARDREPFFTPERAELRIDRGVTEYYEWRLDRIPLPDGRNEWVLLSRHLGTGERAQGDRREPRGAARSGSGARTSSSPLSRTSCAARALRNTPRDHETRRRRRAAGRSRRATPWSGS